jgi:hypothetical protein
VDIFKFQTVPSAIDAKIKRTFLKPDIFSVRFGHDFLLFGDKMPKADSNPHLTHIYSSPDKFLLLEWHIVVQKERLFQRHFPEIPIVYDAGRYLLVRLDPEYVEELKGKHESCYDFIPLRRGQVIFEDVDLAVFRQTPVKSIQALVDALDLNNVKNILEFLASFHTRLWTSPEYMEAARRMGDLLRGMNYDVSLKPIGLPGRSSLNVIADKQGSGSGTRKVVIVSAHLDSINKVRDGVPGPGGEFPAPGADDNASGCAGLMEIARVFQSHQGQHDLRLILFGGEELNYIGSKIYVTNLLPAEQARIKAIVNMDMIGFLNNPSQKVLIDGSFFSTEVTKGLLESAATYTNLSVVRTSFFAKTSDHLPFIWERLPAVLTCEGMETTPAAIDPRIHSANDSINTINYDLALEILRMNVGYIAKELS